MNIMKVALIQMPVVADKSANISKAIDHIRAMKLQGAEMAVLPEMFCSPYDTKCFVAYGEEQGGEVQQAMSALAKELGIYIVAGSIPEFAFGKVYNTSFVYAPDGSQVAKHRKMHLFDINIEGGQYFRESDVLSAGDEATVFDTPWGKMGLGICFDIRFSEFSMLLALQGAQAIIFPGAFNMTTGPAHWEMHFRARAVDNQVFTIGVAPARVEGAGYVSYGHSLVCDPWGTVLHDSGPYEGSHVVEIDLAKNMRVRKQLPIMSARRTDLYTTALTVCLKRAVLHHVSSPS
ncbi:MAG: carbon-nitrogen hydrolase family protein [bacterium]|nr:carbon-nitrogen hydrolase family protein [bacterium]